MSRAFLSYSSRYKDWVATFHRNLERCLRHASAEGEVFLDQLDLSSGASWVGRLDQGLGRADQLILVLTPEALASAWVTKEWQAFLGSRGPRRRLHVVHLLETPSPPLLGDLQWVDFREHDETKYRAALEALVTGLLGKRARDGVDLSPEVEIPEPPRALASGVRSRLEGALAAQLDKKPGRRAVEAVLGLERNALEDFPSPEHAAAVAVVLATGDDDPRAAARRIVDVLIDELEVEKLEELRDELAVERAAEPGSGLLGGWLLRVVDDHERLVPYFQQRTELTLLDRVYVQLQLATEHRRAAEEPDSMRSRGPWSLRKLLALDPENHSWVTHRWVVLGDPGAGKTTLLRHLAATEARARPTTWVPIFESLSRLMREPEWLLDRIARQMRRAGEPAEGLPAVLDRAGQEGRLLLLLDGLDEVPPERREEAEALLRQLARRWPRTPVVVTSRPIGYRRPAADFRELDLLPFDRERRLDFLARWFGRETGEPDPERAAAAATVLEQDSGLRDLASNPLYLTLMALLIEQDESPDRNRPRLYDQVFRLLLKGEHREPPTPMERPGAVRRMLCHLGYGMTEDNRDTESVDEIEDRLYRPEADKVRKELERVARWRPRLSLFLKELAERTGILGPHDGPQADWRYWHRTFREALASEALAARLEGRQGQKALLEHARRIATEDLSRWAEPYALLTGRVKDPDALVRTLVQENRALGLRALATAETLADETLDEVLELSEEWQERRKVYERVPELIGEPLRALALLDRLRRRTRDGNDLFFLERAVEAMAEKWPDAERAAKQLQGRFFDHIPTPEEDLFRWIETPSDGRVELWREIPAGTFKMGSLPAEEGGYGDERPRHEVTIRRPFRMMAVPVTGRQYSAFDPGHRSYHQGEVSDEALPYHPVEMVTWYQAFMFCRWLSASVPQLEGARLPTEEQWEYACRAGSQTRYWSGDSEEDLARIGWYGGNSGNRLHRVGKKPASPWGLHDVHGNVREWTNNEWTGDYSGRSGRFEEGLLGTDSANLAATGGATRVTRGWSYLGDAGSVRSAYRNQANPGNASKDLGFRVLVVPPA